MLAGALFLSPCPMGVEDNEQWNMPYRACSLHYHSRVYGAEDRVRTPMDTAYFLSAHGISSERFTMRVATIPALAAIVTLTAGAAALAANPLEQPTAIDAAAPTVSFASESTQLVGFCCDSADAACGDGCSCGDSVGCGCGKKAAKPNPCATSHKPLFYLNDFSYLNDPCYSGCCLGDCLKQIPMGSCCCPSTLDIGGQFRMRYHHEVGMGRSSATMPPNRGFLDTTNDFLLTRLRLYADYNTNRYLRFYVEGNLADAGANSNYNPRPIDENYGDLLNAFVDVKLTDSFTMRVGRQELLFGAQRLISPLDWANTRRTFEGIRGMYKSGDWTIDGFYTNYVPVVNDQFDEADYDRSFYGLYSTYSGCDDVTYDLYYIGYDDERALTPAASDFSLHTIGSRAFGKTCEGWLYELEGGYQFGRQSGLGVDHSAGFVTGGLGRKLNGVRTSPTLWLYLDYASGDSAGGDFNRFNHLYPLAHKYLGFIDAAARSNIISPNMLLTTKANDNWNLLMWYYYLGAAQANDVVPGVAVPSAQRTDSNDFGNELDLIAKRKLSARSNILFGYSHLWRGSKIIGTNDADFFYTQWELNF